MTSPTILLVVNQSTLITDVAAVDIMAAAVGRQIRKHAAPAWGRVPTPVIVYEAGRPVPDGAVPLVLLDNSDQAGALGYHDETPDGQQYGRIFVEPVLSNGGDVLSATLSVASVLSHEALEWFIDPTCNHWADDGNGTAYAIEVGDPVEADVYNVPIRGTNVTVSNFVTPDWFDPHASGGSQFDLLGNVHEAFEMTAGGYVIRLQEGQVTEQFGDEVPEWRRAGKDHPAARTQRRQAHYAARGPKAAGRPVA